jgi:hypothetical protein
MAQFDRLEQLSRELFGQERTKLKFYVPVVWIEELNDVIAVMTAVQVIRE